MVRDLEGKAVVCSDAGSVVVRRVNVPSPGPRDVVIRTLVSGVSTGTDGRLMRGTAGMTYPMVPGYQLAGIVEFTGKSVEEFAIGQEVVVVTTRDYADARACMGAHSSRVVADADNVYDASGISPRLAALLVVAQVGFNAASRITLSKGVRVLVIGDGVIGAAGALACVARGFDVLVAGRHNTRLKALQRVGLPTFNTKKNDGAELREFPADAVIDTVHNEEAFATALTTLPPREGQLVFSGAEKDAIECLAHDSVGARELTAHFISGWTDKRLEATLEMMRNQQMPLDQVIGETAVTRESTEELMLAVAERQLRPVAAAIDWSWAE